MSFILDALRRAQDAHDHATVDAAPILADQVPSAPANLRRNALWLAAGMTLLTLVALIAWWSGRESVSPTVAAPVTTAPEPVLSIGAAPRAREPVRALDQEAARGRPTPAPAPAQIATDNTPAAPDQTATSRAAASPAAVTPGTVTVAPAPVTAQSTLTNAERDALPQYDNLLTEGKINLPNLKMDMHVYNSQPAKRFVFINFKKYREGDTLDRATAIEEITRRGAVLNHRGERFLLEPN